MKNTVGPLAPGLGYRLAQVTVAEGIIASHISWDALPVRVSADEALAANADDARGGATRAAREFLAEVLMDGPRPTATVMEMAEARGITERTLERARKLLGVVSTKDGFQGKWMLSLPPKPPNEPPKTAVSVFWRSLLCLEQM